MNDDNMTPATPVMPAAPSTPPPEDAPALVKKIGKMTYIVRVHFSTTSSETFEGKVKRLLRNDVRQLMERENT